MISAHIPSLRLLTLLFAVFGSLYAQAKPLQLATYEKSTYIDSSFGSNSAVAEIMEHVMADAGIEYDIQFMPFARSKSLAASGEVHGVFPVTLIESEEFLLSDPILPTQYGFLIPSDYEGDFSLIELTDSSKVGMLRGQLLPETTQARLFYGNSSEQLLRMLERGRIEYLYTEKTTAIQLLIDRFPTWIGEFRYEAIKQSHQHYRVAFSKNHPEAETLLERFNHSLAKVREQGVTSQISRKYGLEDRKEGSSKLRIATVNNNDMKVMQTLSKQFEDESGIQLEWHVMEENVLRKRLMADIVLSEGEFDVFTIGSYEAPLWGKDGWIIPMETNAGYQREDLIESIAQSLSHQDQLYALPFYGESSVLYFRTDLFAEKGIQPVAEPTFTQVKSWAKQLHSPESGQYGICMRGKPGWGENTATISTLVNTHGGRWFDETWQPQMDSMAWSKALNTYVTMAKYAHPEVLQQGYVANLNLFTEGRCAMWIDATVAAGTIFNPKTSKVADVVDISAAPYETTKSGRQTLWSWALAVPASSQSQHDAKHFIHWATSTDYIQRVADQYGWISVPPGTRKSTYQNEQYLAVAPFAKAVQKALLSADPNKPSSLPVPYRGIQFVAIPEYSAIGTQIGRLTGELLQEKITIEQFQRSAMSITQELIRERQANRLK